MKNLIAICGLDCETCDARIATLTDDDALRERTARALSKGFATCGDCPDMETCETVGMVHRSNADARARLKGRNNH